MLWLCRERSCSYPGRYACLSCLTAAVEQSLRRCALTGQKSAEDENPVVCCWGKVRRPCDMLVLVSFGHSQTPTGEMNARRVMKSLLIDLASVECIVLNTSIVAKECYGARFIIRLRPDRHLIRNRFARGSISVNNWLVQRPVSSYIDFISPKPYLDRSI